MEQAEARDVPDEEIADFLREVAVEGYETDEEIVRAVACSLAHDHPGQPDLGARVARLAPPVFDALHEVEATWPIPTDNDRLDRAFAALEKDGIHTLQNWYGSQLPADEEMQHELKFARERGQPYRGFAFFHGGDTRRAIAGEGLRITWGAALPKRAARAKLERASWEIAQELHRALWEQGLSPEWSRVVGEPITLPFTWRRRRRRLAPARPPPPPPSPESLRMQEELEAFAPPDLSELTGLIERLRRRRLRPVPPPDER